MDHGLKQSMENERKRWHFKESMDDEKKIMGQNEVWKIKKMMLFQRKYG